MAGQVTALPTRNPDKITGRSLARLPTIANVTLNGASSAGSAALAALESAGARMDRAASSIDPDDPGSYVDAAMEMSEAKTEVVVAGALLKAQNEMFASTLNILA